MAVLNLDPTRTTGLRRQFMVAMRKRFLWLRKQVLEHVYIDDAYGLDPSPTEFVTNVKRQYEFLTDDGKVQQFRSWLKSQVDTGVLEVADEFKSKPWTSEYIGSAYKKGATRAYIDSKPELLDAPDKSLFLSESFNSPAAVDKIQLLGTRSFNGLEGITNAMSNDMNRIFADGMAHGRGARVVAKELVDSIAGMTRNRAMTLARTEIINAYSEASLDSYEKLGIEELGVQIEWSTAGDDRVCPRCIAMEGAIFTTKEARGVIPLHPNCRCAWIPFFPKKEREERDNLRRLADVRQ